MSHEGAPAPEPSFGQGAITRLGLHLRELFASKAWPRLERESGIDEIWFFDAPMTVAAALELAAERLGELDEIEVELDRIQKSEREDHSASGTYTCCLMGFDTDRLTQLETVFDLHLGFRRDPSSHDASDDTGFGGWHLERLGVSSATPEVVPFPEDEAPAGAPGAEAASGGSEPTTPYGAPLAGVGDGSEVVVYVPVRVPAEQARALLDSALGAAADGSAGSGGAGPPAEALRPDSDLRHTEQDGGDA